MIVNSGALASALNVTILSLSLTMPSATGGNATTLALVSNPTAAPTPMRLISPYPTNSPSSGSASLSLLERNQAIIIGVVVGFAVLVGILVGAYYLRKCVKSNSSESRVVLGDIEPSVINDVHVRESYRDSMDSVLGPQNIVQHKQMVSL